MANEYMVVVFVQSVVDGRLVSNNRTAVSDEMTDDGDNCGCFGVGSLLRYLVGMCLFLNLACFLIDILGFPFHSHTEHRNLRLGSTLRALGFLPFVLVCFTPAKIHFVTLHNT